MKKVHSSPISECFPLIPGDTALIELPEYVVKNLSTDQKNCYKLAQAIKSGIVPKELSTLKCGPLNHSRWLTTAEALLFLWIRDHGLQGEVLRKFKMIVHFVLESYLKLYFDIKVKHNLVHGPLHILSSIEILRMQPKEVQDIIEKYVLRSAFHAHPENLLLALLASTNTDDS